jgi:uncharacterized membrane protein
MNDRPADPASQSRHKLQRLEVLMDSIFAIVIVLLAASIPLPHETGWSGDSLQEFLLTQTNEISFAVIGMVMVVIYWIQNNLLFENLVGTDNKHSILSLVQIFLLLVYFYAIGLSMDFEDQAAGLAMQSISAALVGFAAVAAWWYASTRRRLLSADTDDATIREITINILAEPVTALITLPFVSFGPDIWGASWLAYPLVSYLLKKIILEKNVAQ